MHGEEVVLTLCSVGKCTKKNMARGLCHDHLGLCVECVKINPRTPGSIWCNDHSPQKINDHIQTNGHGHEHFNDKRNHLNSDNSSNNIPNLLAGTKKRCGGRLCEICQSKQASFAEPGGKARRCKGCSSPDMVNVRSKRCKECDKIACYGTPGSKTSEYCMEHGEPLGMVDIRNPTCQSCFTKHALYNYEGEKKPLYCKACKDNSMVDVKNPRCVLCPPTNARRTVFGEKGTTKPTHCKDHRIEGMENLLNPQCRFAGCEERAYFNEPEKKGRRWCRDHKTSSMISKGRRLCEIIGCDRFAVFGGDKVPIRCGQHKDDNMENISHKKCAHENCKKQPSYNFEGLAAAFCKEHSQDGMVRIGRMCTQCGTRARYGFPGKKAERCVQHRERGMVADPRKTCEEPNCRDYAIYGYRISCRVHCESHKIEGEQLLIGGKCDGCGFIDILSREFKCYTCDPDKFHKFRLAKQLEVKAWLDSNGLKGTYVYDRALDEGKCLRNRPDFIFDCGSHMLILEVDEHQHRNYTPECERVREVNLAQANGIQTVFLRYNPDKYLDVKMKRHDPTRRHRMDEILRWVNHLRTPVHGKRAYFCSEYRIFFDGYKKSEVKELCIIPWEECIEPETKKQKCI